MINKIIKNLSIPTKRNLLQNFILGAFIFALILMVYTIVYVTGGTISSLMHLSYIPIFFSVFLFNTNVGLLTAIAVGIAVGPLMPIDGSVGMEHTISWIIRIIVFVIIVSILGLLVSHIRKINKNEKRRAYEDIVTGYPNSNKLRYDLTNMAMSNNKVNFSLIIFEFNNLEMINKHIDYDTGKQSFIQLLDMAKDFFAPHIVYTVYFNKFLIVIPGCNKVEAYNYSYKFLYLTKNPILINKFPVSIMLKGGIVNYPLHCDNIDDIFVKIEKVIEQAKNTQKEIVIYDRDLSHNNDSYYNTLITLYDALKNNEFTLVYQPKINLTTNEIIGVEALLRLNKLPKQTLSIEQFIKMAEDAGFIKEVSKWVINYALGALKKLIDDGFDIKISVNLSSVDLNDDMFFEYVKDRIESYGIDPELLEFELTERIIVGDEEKVFKLLRKIKNYGIKLSLDDYGAGYNSFNYILYYVNIFDYMKIDKYFIDKIDDDKNKLVIKGIVDIAHGLGVETIAEGVEEKYQIDILKRIGCNIGQGYYLCKPLELEKLKEFIINR